MKILNSQKFLLHSMTKQEYRTGMVHLMIKLENHSEEFKTPEQLIALIHEYTELLATVYSLDHDDDDLYFDDMDDDTEDEDEDDTGAGSSDDEDGEEE